jgi:SPP1 family phage portal protein
MQRITSIIESGAASAMGLQEIIKQEVEDWLLSPERDWMIAGQRYYRNDSDILDRKREVIGENGQKVEDKNLANNRLVHGFVRKLVDQKTGYLLSKPLSVQTDNDDYLDLLAGIFDKRFLRLLKSIGKEAVNKGKAWLHVYYDQEGELSFKKIPSEEIIALWKDAAHTELDAVIRVYEIDVYEGKQKKAITKVEFWDTNGVLRFVLDESGLIPDVEAGEEGSHFVAATGDDEQPLNWERVPFICFKYNEEEMPLVQQIKSLVDDYDERKSDNSNNLEDLPNSIYVIKDYDGTDLGEFRRNLSAYRAVKVTGEGGLDTKSLDINVEAFKVHMEMNRKDIYEFGRGVDTQSKEFGSSPSGISLKFLYADLDMDANDIETEFQAALEHLLWFIDQHIANTTGKYYSDEKVDLIFNRDILINETDTITNVKNSVGVISDETLVANHPWVMDVQDEQDRIAKQRSGTTGGYGGIPQDKPPGGGSA